MHVNINAPGIPVKKSLIKVCYLTKPFLTWKTFMNRNDEPRFKRILKHPYKFI